MESSCGEDWEGAVGRALWNSRREVMVTVRDGRVVEANGQFCRRIVGGGDDVAGRLVTDWFEDEGATAEDLLACSVESPIELQARIDGSVWELTATPMPDGMQLLQLHDVTAYRRARRELAQMRGAIEDSLNGYVIFDASRRLSYCNRAWLDMFGYGDVDEVYGRSPADVGMDAGVAREVFDAVERDGQTTNELQVRRRDGSAFEILQSMQVSRDHQGNKAYISTSLDVSELKQLRQDLFHSQKLEAIGRLAASVAHDFNNMLSPILGFTEMMQLESDRPETERRMLEQMHDAGRRARDLTGQLLALGRRQLLEPRPTDLRDAVRELEGLLRQSLREDIDLEIDLGTEPCTVLVDPAQLQQLLFNLTSNAQDAMPSGGRMTIEVGTRALDESAGTGREEIRAGVFGELVVRDDGNGIDPVAIEQIFEPFFTTKGPLGHGLGLASVQGIVKQHGGHVQVHSEPGRGSAFRVYLPLTDRRVESTDRPVETPKAANGGTVLVVEDNDLVRDLTEQILGNAGYRVLVAASGREAEELLASSDRAVDLVLTDVVLTDTNGKLLADQIRAKQPDVAVLFMSGYTDDVIVHHGVVDPEINLLHKPFSASELLDRVRELVVAPPR